jgi:DNA-binding CsgD family transcriptional regulator
MNDPAPSAIPPPARDVVNALAGAPTTPTKLVVTGGIGTGKTTVLGAIRVALRAAGVPIISRVPRPDETPSAAVVIDDAHLLAEDELHALAERVADPETSIIVATEPHQHSAALRALTLAMERENAAVSLGGLAPAELNRAASGVLPNPPSSELLRALMTATAGVPLLVRAALDAATSDDDGSPAMAFAQGARFALIDRLRRVDDRVLEALLIASLSPDLGAADVAAALHVSGSQAQELVDRARATGLVEPSHSPPFLRSVHRAVTQILGAARHHDIERSLLASQIEMSTLSTDLALRLAEHGFRDERLAGVLQEHADQAHGQPARAARLYRAAVEAGAEGLDSRLADALVLTGDCATAGRLADDLLASDDAEQRAAAVRVAAAIAAHDGNAAQAAELFRWLGPHPDAFVSAAAAVALLAAGDATAARAALDAQGSGPPTTAARAARSLAEGLLASLDQPFAVAVSKLGQALTSDQPATGAAPDTPEALITLAALHGGDPVRARTVITRAVRAGGDDLSTHRHRLLLGWVKMQDGQLASASADVSAVGESGLHRRDALWAEALRTGIARRTGDEGGLQKHWYAAMEVLAEYSIDLFSLLPLGELWVAAVRLRQLDRVQHQLDQAFGLLGALGNPVLWSVPLHWSGVHAGILANSPDAVAPHGQALTAAPAHSAFARSLAGAGRVWLRVLAKHVDIDEVTAAAKSLSQFGHTWEATRLASQAALQTPDSKVSGAMLQLARDLKLASPADEAPTTEPGPAPSAASGARPAPTRLSEREREVAELLLLGMPYRDIGGQLFISAKTVEHHVARIRRRLGAESRSEMLSMLRAMLASES